MIDDLINGEQQAQNKALADALARRRAAKKEKLRNLAAQKDAPEGADVRGKTWKFPSTEQKSPQTSHTSIGSNVLSGLKNDINVSQTSNEAQLPNTFNPFKNEKTITGMKRQWQKNK